MDLDLQNDGQQAMDLDSQIKPRFSVGCHLATLITSCGILKKAWEICNVPKNKLDFFLKKDEDDVAYVSFHSLCSEDFKHGEYNIQEEKSFYACLWGNNDKPALVHKGAFERFKSIIDKKEFKTMMDGLKAKTIIFVGHSTGGAVATLATLWFLQKKAQDKSYFCITFGSPLVGNSILGEAIGREGWTGKFCHVVSKHDIVPRVLLAPVMLIEKPLKVLVPHWWGVMHTVAATNPSIKNDCRTFLKKFLEYTSTIANDSAGVSDPPSIYRPFGTYMFCSDQGAACIDDSEAVLKMLHFTMQEMSFDKLVSDHTCYGKMLETITNALPKAMPIANVTTDSFEMGIVLELEAMGVGDQEKRDAFCALKKAGGMENMQDAIIKKLNYNLSQSQHYMAKLESYKSSSKTGSGYYDNFKQHWEMRDEDVNKAREDLGAFWKDIIKKEEMHLLPSDFRGQNKWINAGTAYRRLVEPLDIAHYYQTRKDSNLSYLSDEVRPYHHQVLEKWLKEKDETRTGKLQRNRIEFASLTLDSCFWARLEDACQNLTTLHREKSEFITFAMIRCQEFQDVIYTMIEEMSISEEVFLKKSSFMIWWDQYSKYLQTHFSYLKENSSLFSFMTWREKYNSCLQRELPQLTLSSPLLSFKIFWDGNEKHLDGTEGEKVIQQAIQKLQVKR
ncbi:hypothetical protein SUGI_0039280 [Cryptomeria japonica]|uniref:lipase-like PAD4 n=1 Tax=Cryptomeria japonica TaxID=3369 RepID=UPI002408DB84|nr:lipase-like PAD4 [Cryptomeria japonica]GLJ06443.1 hypothetical protein SUGI_0039280 [Cryptomeria japonica]